MNEDILKGKWNQIKGTLRTKWGKLTNDDVDKVQGNFEKFIGVLQERYGYRREQAEREINAFLGSSTVAGTTGQMEQSRNQPPQGGQRQGDAQKRESEGDEKRRRVS